MFVLILFLFRNSNSRHCFRSCVWKSIILVVIRENVADVDDDVVDCVIAAVSEC